MHLAGQVCCKLTTSLAAWQKKNRKEIDAAKKGVSDAWDYWEKFGQEINGPSKGGNK